MKIRTLTLILLIFYVGFSDEIDLSTIKSLKEKLTWEGGEFKYSFDIKDGRIVYMNGWFNKNGKLITGGISTVKISDIEPLSTINIPVDTLSTNLRLITKEKKVKYINQGTLRTGRSDDWMFLKHGEGRMQDSLLVRCKTRADLLHVLECFNKIIKKKDNKIQLSTDNKERYFPLEKDIQRTYYYSNPKSRYVKGYNEYTVKESVVKGKSIFYEFCKGKNISYESVGSWGFKYYLIEGNLLYGVVGSEVKKVKPKNKILIFKEDAVVGDSFNYKMPPPKKKLPENLAATIVEEITITIVDKESVKVHAGTFDDCLKIKREKLLRNGARNVEYFWLVKGLGMVKKVSTHTNASTGVNKTTTQLVAHNIE